VTIAKPFGLAQMRLSSSISPGGRGVGFGYAKDPGFSGALT
jgi:hypothetical protein